MNRYLFGTQSASGVRDVLKGLFFVCACFAFACTVLMTTGCKNAQVGGQTATLKLDSGFAQVLATNLATAVQGGTIVDAGLFNGPVMVETAKSQFKTAPARVVIGFNFGADAAPNAAALDEETSTLKNDLGRIIDSAKGNPQAAAALALLEGASAAIKPGKALPLGDRTAGQGYMLFEGESADAKEFGIEAVGGFVDVRQAAHGQARATATDTKVRTITVTNDVGFATALGLSYVDYLKEMLQAEKDAEDPLKLETPPAPGKKPTPVAPGVSDEARAAAWYPGVPRGGGNNSAVAAGVGKRFLWKPVSDSNGKAAIHTSNAHYVESLELVSGGTVIETLKISAIGNGHRPLFRASKPGSAYPAGLLVRHKPSGFTVAVPSPSERHEKDGTPEYGPAADKPADPKPTDPPTTPVNREPAGGKAAELTATGLLLRSDVAALVDKVIVIEDAKTNTVNPPKITATRSGNAWTTGKPLSEHRAAVYQLWFTRTPPADVPHHPHFPCATCPGIVGHVTQAETWDPNTVR